MAIRVLFLCTGNSARSIIAEALLRATAGGAFDARSAGTHPRGDPRGEPPGVHPLTLRVLDERGIDASAFRSKPVEAVLDDYDYVITLCDTAAAACPTLPGRAGRPKSYRERLHWSIEDPAAATGSDDDQMAAFRRAYDDIERRVAAFIPLALRVAARRDRRRAPQRIAVLA